MTLVLVLGLVGAGAFAYFSDTETMEDNTFTAGTLNLQVGNNDPCTVHMTYSDIKPDWSDSPRWNIENTGTLDGYLWFEIKNVVNRENGRNEPEIAAGDAYVTEPAGELGAHLTFNASEGVWVHPSGGVNAKYYIYDSSGRTFMGDNPTLMSINDLEGVKFHKWAKSADAPGNKSDWKLKAGGEFQEFLLRIWLPGDTGNIVQSDSVEFDIIFHLDQ